MINDINLKRYDKKIHTKDYPNSTLNYVAYSSLQEFSLVIFTKNNFELLHKIILTSLNNLSFYTGSTKQT